jgi:saccharopine dehydrogenase-like NADP-dependent oxidoreductase
MNAVIIGCGRMSYAICEACIDVGVKKICLIDLDKAKQESVKEYLKNRSSEIEITTDIQQNNDFVILSLSGPETKNFLQNNSINFFPEGSKQLYISLGRPNYEDREETFQFNEWLISQSISLYYGFGLEPGLAENIASFMLQYNNLENIQNLEIYCGGVPLIAKPPLYYEVLFGSYIPHATRNTLKMCNSKILEFPRFSLYNEVFVPKIGLFDAYDDGLSPYFLDYIKNKNIINVSQQTLRWPGFVKTINTIRTLDLLDDTYIEKYGTSPIDFLHFLLSKNSPPFNFIDDLTILHCIVSTASQKSQFITLKVYGDRGLNLTGMAKITGYYAVYLGLFALQNPKLVKSGISYSFEVLNKQDTLDMLNFFRSKEICSYEISELL